MGGEWMARLTLLVALSRVATGQLALPTFSKLTDLPLDEHGHLKDHMLRQRVWICMEEDEIEMAAQACQRQLACSFR